MTDQDQTNPPVAEAGEQAAAPITVEELGVVASPPTEAGGDARLRALVEAVVYVAEEPLTAAQIATALSLPRERVDAALEELTRAYDLPHHGLWVREVAGGYKMGTKPEFHEELRAFVRKLKPPLKLSLAALETLAVIAYKQPITAPEILEIRGVQGAGVLKTLLERRLITTSGRKQVIGRPILYRTTREFLLQFGLKDLAELPTLKEFEEWSRLALGEAETPPEPGPAPEPEAQAAPEPDAEPEAAPAPDTGNA